MGKTGRGRSTRLNMTKAMGVRTFTRICHSQIVVGVTRSGRSEAARECGEGNDWRSQEYKIGDDECFESSITDALLSQPDSGSGDPQW